LLPSGRAGKEFIEETTRLIHEWVNNSPLHEIALKALMVMPSLLLQKPNKKSKAKEHADVLSKRLHLWKEGDIDLLVREARFIQLNLPKPASKSSFDTVAKRFNDLMLMGKVNQALRILSDSESKERPVLEFGDFAYKSIDGNLIRKIAKDKVLLVLHLWMQMAGNAF